MASAKGGALGNAAQNNPVVIVAPANGELLPLDQCSDKTFAKGKLGPGFIIKPTDGYIYSPVAGKVKLIHATQHGYAITTDSGQDILVHLGAMTVEMDDRRVHTFKSCVHVGDYLQPGDRLADAHWGAVRAAGSVAEVVVIASEASPEALVLTASGTVAASDPVATLV